MEAPYIRIDPILNYRDADRSLRFNDTLARAIWIHATDKYGTDGTYQVSIVAHQDRPERYFKAAVVADTVAVGDLDDVLEQAAGLVSSWSESDLPRAGRAPRP